MDVTRSEISGDYAKMGEPELMEIARAYDSLTEMAQGLLREEFAKRGLEPPIIEEDQPEVEGRRLVTVRRYRDLSEAIVARTLVESAGIPVYLRDENLVRLDWQVSNFIGGIRLQVEVGDEAAALEMLEQPIPESIEWGGEQDYAQPQCPKCGSTDITFEGESRGAALASLYLLALPVPKGAPTWLCAACGARWADDEDELPDQADAPAI